MRAITVEPGAAGSIRLDEAPEPEARPDALLVQALALGVCGTDREIIEAKYGEAPPGAPRLILGHESLGRVIEAPPGAGFAEGDLVVGVVRRPDPAPCPACAGGEWDMCRNGRYTERGIKQAHGYGCERFRLRPQFAIRVDEALGLNAVLVEPASVVAKAWDRIERIGARTRTWRAGRVLVTGAGAVGLLAAMMGRQRGLEVHVYDHNREGLKPRLAQELGATYHCGELEELAGLEPDVTLECTGVDAVVRQVLAEGRPGGIVCLVGLSDAGRQTPFDIGRFNQETVLDNRVVFGTVNANLAHYDAAAEALARADQGWLSRLISRRVPLERWAEAFEHRHGDVKVALTWAEPAAAGLAA
jgi:threonine dehydrogenase-like Zn-dependent dehydrogenase